MIDIRKQIEYWRNGAQEDWQVANELVELKRTRHGLFFAHLALEKMLKAHVCRVTNNLAPKIHNLVRLAELTKLLFLEAQWDFIADFDQYQLEGRYPDKLPTPLTKNKAQAELKKLEELLAWLIKQF